LRACGAGFAYGALRAGGAGLAYRAHFTDRPARASRTALAHGPSWANGTGRTVKTTGSPRSHGAARAPRTHHAGILPIPPLPVAPAMRAAMAGIVGISCKRILLAHFVSSLAEFWCMHHSSICAGTRALSTRGTRYSRFFKKAPKRGAIFSI